MSHSQTNAANVVVLAGATGQLGSLIARALLAKPGVTLRCLVRRGSEEKLAELRAAGAELVEADLNAGSEAALAAACQGAYAVIAAVQGGPDVIVDGQLRLLRAAMAGGARRFIPSDYSFDFFKLPEGANLNADWRRRFARLADEEAGSRIEIVHVLNGIFAARGVLAFVGFFDFDAGVARLWGDGNMPMELTTYADTARYVAEAAIDPEPLPAWFYVAGDIVSFRELVRAYEEGKGRTLTIEQQGSLDELVQELARRRSAQPQNVMAWLPLMYAHGVLSGAARLGPLENGRYPHLRPASVRDAIASGEI